MSWTPFNTMKTATSRVYSGTSLCHVRGYRAEVQGDTTVDVIRRILYPTNVRSRETPTGGWRSDVARALRISIPSRQAHETIERAWLLRERHLRKQRETEAERKFNCMRRAMDALEQFDPVLFKEANKSEDPRKHSEEERKLLVSLHGVARKALERRLPGLFPHEMRLPTDTPPIKVWDYDWKSPICKIP